jgi:hypothetical protein
LTGLFLLPICEMLRLLRQVVRIGHVYAQAGSLSPACSDALRKLK